ncbi:OmpA family protein [Aliiroseovarius sediminilitoris]|uniref:OmpA family protein n=1 Tax=Aliiroseovarius sediminilitoris TaxID=1173584 RepID=A0A1I0R5Q6_9RHOB|nr:OmpA family protein [Aliiroseovarius sediminilitoris]SEW35902.1 OmpA family protein [Aliiroseovarius sediminilitoris]
MPITWKSSTALVATLSMAFPAPIVAQTNASGAAPSVLCVDGSETPCASGVPEIPAESMICENGAALPCGEGVIAVPKSAMICADGAPLPCGEGVDASLRPDMAGMLTALRESGMTPEIAQALNLPIQEGGTAEPAAEVATDTGTVEAAPAEEAPAVEAEAAPADAAPVEAAPEAEAEVTEKAPEAETAEANPSEEPAPDTVESDTVTEATTNESIVAPEAEPTGEVAETPDAQTPAQSADTSTETTEAEPVEAPVEQTAEQPAEQASDVSPEEEAALADALTDTEPTAEEAVTSEPVPELPVQPAAESGEAPVAAAAAAPVEADTSAEVTEEVVTEETARSSDEDFANKVNEAVKTVIEQKDATASAKRDEGLSKGEKAILLGLGAVAVGAILSNNREVALNSGDRVVVSREDGSYEIIKDDNALLRQPGTRLRTETFGDGSTRTTVIRPDGTEIVTVRDPEYRVLRRVHVAEDGTETVLIDDTVAVEPVDVTTLPDPVAQQGLTADADEDALRRALAREGVFDRRFSLAQIRHIPQVRNLVPVIDLNAVTFETGSAAIRPDQARSLARLGKLIQSYVANDRNEVFLIEGHTDAVGSAAYNLALSDRRAESVALALTEYFDVPPENLIVQGYGEAFLKVDTELEERANRRASVRRITPLLRQASN